MDCHNAVKQLFIDEQYERALEILRSKRNILNQAAETLFETETIQGEELAALEASVSKHSDMSDDTDVPDDRHAMAA